MIGPKNETKAVDEEKTRGPHFLQSTVPGYPAMPFPGARRAELFGSRTVFRPETHKIAPALVAAVFLRAKGHEEIRQQPRIIVFARPGAEIGPQAAGAFCVRKTRPEHHAN
jgi:hypothetical protein